MGGAYATGGAENNIMFQTLIKAAKVRFPFLPEFKPQFKPQFQWSGYLAITDSHLPHIFDLGNGCSAGIGCNGRGIAMTTMLGKVLAQRHLHSQQQNEHNAMENIPVSGAKRITFHDLRNIGITASVAWNRLLDSVNK